MQATQDIPGGVGDVVLDEVDLEADGLEVRLLVDLGEVTPVVRTKRWGDEEEPRQPIAGLKLERTGADQRVGQAGESSRIRRSPMAARGRQGLLENEYARRGRKREAWHRPPPDAPGRGASGLDTRRTGNGEVRSGDGPNADDAEVNARPGRQQAMCREPRRASSYPPRSRGQVARMAAEPAGASPSSVDY